MAKILINFKKIPALSVCVVFFILGILAANFINIPFFVLLTACFILLVSAFLFGENNLFFSLVLILFSFSFGILHTENCLRLPDNHIFFACKENIRSPKILGVVACDPVYALRKTSFILKVKRITIGNQTKDSCGLVLVNVFNKGKFFYGDELVIEGKLYKPFDYAGVGNFSYRDYLKNRGIYCVLSASKQNKTIVVGSNKGNLLSSLAFRLKHKIKNIFQRYLLPVNSRVLSGIMLGERYVFPKGIMEVFIRTGTAHIIAISGFNVGIIIFILVVLFKSAGIKHKTRCLLVIPIVLIHCIAVGASPSVVRATIMAVFMLGAYIIGREPNLINSLSLAALTILAYNPLQIFDPAFELSFASVLGIIILSPKIINLSRRSEGIIGGRDSTNTKVTFGFRPGGAPFFKNKISYPLKVIGNSFAVSLSAWLATCGIAAYYFKIITPVAILANLIIVPMVSLVIVLGFGLFLSACVFSPFAYQFAASINFVLSFIFKISAYLSNLPFAYFYL